MLDRVLGSHPRAIVARFSRPQKDRGLFSFEEWRKLVDKKLDYYHSDRWTSKKAHIFLSESEYSLDLEAVNKNLNEPIRDFVLRGGKRIRPLLFLTCLEIFKKDPEKYLDIAVAIELIHNGTLVLDDIEDNAEMRRGKPACHKKYGLDTAVNSGMSLHIMPLMLIANNESGLNKKQQNKIWKIYTQELSNLSFGQALDIYWHKNDPRKITQKEYLEMVRLKTGSLMRVAIRMACAIADVEGQEESVFSKYAEKLGMTFQIIDDCLDLDPQDVRFGKSYGNDITEGKISLPVIYSLDSLKASEARELANILTKHTADKKLITEAVKMIKSVDSLKKSKALAENILSKAWEDLGNGYKKNNLKRLEELSSFVLHRKY